MCSSLGSLGPIEPTFFIKLQIHWLLMGQDREQLTAGTVMLWVTEVTVRPSPGLKNTSIVFWEKANMAKEKRESSLTGKAGSCVCDLRDVQKALTRQNLTVMGKCCPSFRISPFQSGWLLHKLVAFMIRAKFNNSPLQHLKSFCYKSDGTVWGTSDT